MIDENRLIEEVEDKMSPFQFADETREWALKDVIEVIEKQPKINEWIPFKLDENGILESPLPEENQEILISVGDSVWMDTFLKDGEDCYLDSNIDLIGLYWMPLPKPHKKEAEE